MSGLTLDLQVAPYSSSERDLAAMHLMKSTHSDVMLYDRGCPEFWFFALHTKYQRNFCMRAQPSLGPQIEAFSRSSRNEQIMTFSASKKGKTKCRQLELKYNDIQLRLVKVILPTGEIEILITSLLDQNQYPQNEFKALYHSRWGIEEDYKTQKLSLETESFSGLTVHSVMQDLHAKVFIKNVTMAAANLVQPSINKKYANRKHAYKVNKNQAISKMRPFFVKLKNSVNPIRLFEKLFILLIDTIEPVRPNRSFPRRFNETNKKHHINIKGCR